ncbi:hypothetical protein C8J55DRAFT_258024 [Lentinula edodes]|uniref:Uncharacterized protein n=1 Tax=Lentinula lateritia TaxID=40482 RepID=A0A9W8ZSX4_9AGAR|nr:hypothetical protein C8J55DRAFT_258024 [Lentinula edodes]
MEMRLAEVFHRDKNHLLSRHQNGVEITFQASSDSLKNTKTKYPLEAYIKQEHRKQEDDKEEIRRDIALVKNFPNLHEHYKEIADRLSAHLDEPPSFNINPSLSVQKDCYSMGLLRAITDLFSEPYDGRDPTIEKLRKAFEEGESPENLRAILRDSPEPGIH